MNKYLMGILLISFVATVVTDTTNTQFNEYSNNATCITCKSIVQIIDDEVHISNKTIGIITHDIEYICSKLKSPIGKECQVIANDIQKIVSYIDKGFNNTKICNILGFC
jgi:ABC-type enterochelin transport system ATPase subunit